MMLKTLVRHFARLPLAGKFSVATVIATVFSSTTKKERWRSVIICVVFLWSLSVFHVLQAGMGVRVIRETDSAVFCGLALCYAVINIMATIAQVYLTYRVLRFAIKYRGRYFHSNEGRSIKRFSRKEYRVSLMFTVLAQVVFLWIYLWTI